MAQKDYVSRGRTGSPRKRNGKKKKNARGVSTPLLLLALVVLAAFAGGLYFLKTHNAADAPPKQTQRQDKKNTLPPRPEKRWTYPDKLENPRDSSLVIPPAASDGSSTPGTSLSNEQRQLLAQMQADMRQPAVALPGTYNQQVTQRDTATTASGNNTSSNNNVSSTVNTAQPATRVTPPPATAAVAQNWMLQCGSFRNAPQAESVKATLALAGISSQVTTRDGWHRVMLGPYNSRDASNAMLPRLQSAGVAGCISIAPKG